MSYRVRQDHEVSLPALEADFQIKDFGTGQAEVLGEGRSLKIEEGRFTDEFNAWGVHLYKIALIPGV